MKPTTRKRVPRSNKKRKATREGHDYYYWRDRYDKCWVGLLKATAELIAFLPQDGLAQVDEHDRSLSIASLKLSNAISEAHRPFSYPREAA